MRGHEGGVRGHGGGGGGGMREALPGTRPT